MAEETVTACYVIPERYRDKIKELAQQQDRSDSAVVRRIFASYFGEREPNNGNSTPAPAAEAASE